MQIEVHRGIEQPRKRNRSGNLVPDVVRVMQILPVDGIISLTRSPETLVSMALVSPRISRGALGSYSRASIVTIGLFASRSRRTIREPVTVTSSIGSELP